MDRPETASYSNSEMGLSSITLSKLKVLPEQWTLPQEWNIEKREMFDNWKLDVQEQIKFLDKQLGHSLNQYPVQQQKRCPRIGEADETEEEGAYNKLVVGKMQLGLKRS